MRKFIFAIFAALLFAATAQAQLLQQTDLEYLGAFKLPLGRFGCPTSVNNCMSYSGNVIAFNPANNSLYYSSHDWFQYLSEITVPTPARGVTYANLPTATVLQNFYDPSEGKYPLLDNGTIKLGGAMVVDGKLVFTAYSYYDADASQQLSHFRRPLTTAPSGQVEGPFKLGTLGAGFVSGYMAPIPTAWQTALGGTHLTGNCCIAIVTRTSYGPSVSSFTPSQSLTNSTPLVAYTTAHQTLGAWNSTGNLYNGTTQIRGMVFPDGTSSVLFIGRQGIGTFCYGTGTACNDPAISSSGNHAYPYVYQVWAYDAAELAKVKAGIKQYWEVVPYAVWNFELPFQYADRSLGGASYDPATRQLFIVANNASPGWPVVHVFNVNIPPPPVIEADFTITTKEGRTITVSRQPTTPASNAVLVVDPSMNVIVNGEVVP